MFTAYIFFCPSMFVSLSVYLHKLAQSKPSMFLISSNKASVFSDPAKSEEQQASGSKSIATASSSKTVVTGIKIDNPSSVNGDSTI